MLTLRQLDDWADYAQLEPWGTAVEDLRLAELLRAVAQPHCKKRLSRDDFVLRWGPPPDPPTPEEYRAKSMRVMLASGGKVEG